MVKGLSRDGATRVASAREGAAFRDVNDLARRARLDRGDLEALAAAGALAGLAGDRHRARWACAGVEGSLPLLDDAPVVEDAPDLAAPTEGEEIIADYAHTGLSLGRHPLALVRESLAEQGAASAADVMRLAHGSPVRTAGLVICRQQPYSAGGVVFLTLEDETGHVNVIVWASVAARYRRALLQARLLTVTGQVQREGEVLHVVARRLEDHSGLLGALEVRSRDFC